MSRPKLPSASTSLMLVLTAISMFTTGRAPGLPRLRVRDLEVQITVHAQKADMNA